MNPWWVVLLAGPAFGAGDAGGELRLRWDARGANHRGPLAEANTRAPGIAPVPRGALIGEAELRGTWRPLSANLLLAGERAERGATRWDARRRRQPRQCVQDPSSQAKSTVSNSGRTTK